MPAGTASCWLLRDPDTALIVRVSNEVVAGAAEDLGIAFERGGTGQPIPRAQRAHRAVGVGRESRSGSGRWRQRPVPRGLAAALASRLIRRYSSVSDLFAPARPASDRLSPLVLRRALGYIEAHLDRDIKVADVAAARGLSASHCKEQLRRSTGLHVH